MKVDVARSRFAPPDAYQIRHAWFVRGYSYEVLEDPPGKEWHWETHTVDQVATALDGALVVDIADGSVTIAPGDEAFIPAGLWHRARNASESTPCTWCFGYGSAT